MTYSNEELEEIFCEYQGIKDDFVHTKVARDDAQEDEFHAHEMADVCGKEQITNEDIMGVVCSIYAAVQNNKSNVSAKLHAIDRKLVAIEEKLSTMAAIVSKAAERRATDPADSSRNTTTTRSGGGGIRPEDSFGEVCAKLIREGWSIDGRRNMYFRPSFGPHNMIRNKHLIGEKFFLGKPMFLVFLERTYRWTPPKPRPAAAATTTIDGSSAAGSSVSHRCFLPKQPTAETRNPVVVRQNDKNKDDGGDDGTDPPDHHRTAPKPSNTTITITTATARNRKKRKAPGPTTTPTAPARDDTGGTKGSDHPVRTVVDKSHGTAVHPGSRPKKKQQRKRNPRRCTLTRRLEGGIMEYASHEEIEFYGFSNLMPQLKEKMGWGYQRNQQRNGTSRSWDYVLPGRRGEIEGGQLNRDYFRTWWKVVRYCMDRQYYTRRVELGLRSVGV